MAGTGTFAEFRAWVNEGGGRWLGLLAGLGLILGAVAVFVFSPGSEEDKRERVLAAGRTCLFVCTNPSCGARGTLKSEYFSKWPQVCPKCKQRTAARGIRCPGCGRILLDNRQRFIRCPCGYRLDRRDTPMDDPLPPPERFRK